MPAKKSDLRVKQEFIKKYGGLCPFLVPIKNSPKTRPEDCPSYKKASYCWYNQKRGLDQFMKRE